MSQDDDIRALEKWWKENQSDLKDANPESILEAIQEFMQKIYPSDSHWTFFVEVMLKKCVESILERKEIDYDGPEVVETLSYFVERTVQYCASYVEYLPCLKLLGTIMTFNKKTALYGAGILDVKYGFGEVEDLDPDIAPGFQVSRFYYQYMNAIVKEKCLEKIINLLELRGKDRVSVEYAQASVVFFERIYDLFLRTAETVETVRKCVNRYILELPDEDMRLVDKKVLGKICDEFLKMLNSVYDSPKRKLEKTLKKIETFRLKVALKMLKLPFIQKRLEGLIEITHYCKLSQGHSTKEDRHWVDQAFMCNWLLKNSIVAYFFGEQAHPEILKRSHTILCLLANEGEIQNTELDLIWTFVTSEGKHESIVHLCWEILGHMAKYLHYPEPLNYLFEKIDTLPPHYFESHELIHLIAQVTESCMRRMSSYDQERNTYGLELFWNGIQDNSGFSYIVSGSMLNSLVELLGQPFCKLQRVPFALRCIENLRQSTSVCQSLVVLRQIIGFYSSRSGDKSAEDVILWLNSHQNLLDLFFTSLASYTQHVREATPSGFDAARFYPAGSHYSYSQDIHGRLDFLEFLCRHSPLELQESHIDLLWDNVLLHPVSVAIADVGYNWLKSCLRHLEGYPALAPHITHYIFEKKVPTLNLKALSLEGFNFFEFYFRTVNWAEGFFEAIGNEYRVASLELIGIDTLWSIAFEAQNEQVGDAAISALLSLQRSLSSRLSDKVEQHREDFIRRCMEVLIQSESSIGSATAEEIPLIQVKVTRSLNMIQKLIGLFESSADKHGSAVGNPIKLSALTVTNKEKCEVEMMDTDLVSDLRKKLAEKLGLEEPLVRMIAAGKELSNEKAPIKDYVQSGATIHVVKRSGVDTAPRPSAASPQTPKAQPTTDGQVLPSQILAEKHFDQLFQLLALPLPLCLDVWALLMKLPTNVQMKKRLKEITPATKWEAVLDTRNVFKLYYCLQIVDALLQNNNAEESLTDNASYRETFVSSGGLTHLIATLMKTDFVGASSTDQGGSKKLVCLALVLRIASSLLVTENKLDHELLLHTGVDVPNLLSRLMELLRSIGQMPEPELLQEASIKKQPTDLEQVSELGVKFLTSLLLSDPSWLASFNKIVGENPGWLVLVLLETSIVALRFRVSEMIGRIALEGDLEVTRVWYHYLITLLPALSDPQYHYVLSRKSLPYFRALNALVVRKAKKEPAFEDTDHALLKSTLDAIVAHPNIEQSSASDVDETIQGLLEVTRAFLHSYPHIRSEIGAALLDEVFHRNLFDIPTVNEEGKVPPPRCKTAQSRTAALLVLLDLSANTDLMTRLCEKTLALYETQAFTSHWDYLPSVSEKSSCGLTGLCNLGATCYMNSLMQQLHMNSHFRHKIFSVKDKEDDKKNSVLYQLQSIFSHLQESVLKYYDPTPFCSIYKIYSDESMNPLVQMDVDEFFANIMDRIETLLKGSEQENILKEFFGGEVVNQIIPTECPHVVERMEPFLNLSLEVKNKYQLEQCLDLFIQGDMLEGDNKFHCSKCDGKVTALKRCCINKLPHFLIIHLKRFDFDLELLRRSKINQFCSFPELLNVEPYTKEGLARREQRGEEQEVPSHPDSYFEYGLTGILVHQGTTESGHYYSFIKDRETGNWYKFNDSNVTPFNFNNVAEECFGGTYTSDVWDPQHRKWVTMTHTRSNNAYMLFYERRHPEKELPSVTQEELRQAVPKELYDDIWRENVTFLRDKCLFDRGFTDFTTRILDQINVKEFGEPVEPDVNEADTFKLAKLNISKLAFTFFIKTYAHSKEKDNLPLFTAKLCEVMKVFTPASKWFLQNLIENKESWAVKFFTQCYESKVLAEFTNLIITAITTLDRFEEAHYAKIEEIPNPEPEPEPEALADPSKPVPPPKPKKKLDNSIDVTSVLVPAFMVPVSVTVQAIEFLLRSSSRILLRHNHLSSYWKIFEEAAFVSSELREAMVRRGHLKALMHLYLQEDSPDYVCEKSHTGPSKKTQGSFLASSAPLLSAITTLVCGFSFPRTNQAALDSPYGANGDVLPESDQDYLLRKKTLMRFIGDQYNMVSVSRLCLHLCWENIDSSKLVLETLCAVINRDNNEKFPPYGKLIDEILSISDSYQTARVEYLLNGLLPVLLENLKYPLVSTHTINCMDTVVKKSDVARDLMLQRLDEWAQPLLFHCGSQNSAKLRYAAENLILDLVPEAPGYPTTPPSTGGTSTAGTTAGTASATTPSEPPSDKPTCAPDPVHALPRLSYIMSVMLGLLEKQEASELLYLPRAKTHLDHGFYLDDHKGLSILRLLAWTLSEPLVVNELVADTTFTHLNLILRIFRKVESYRVECDEHKLQLVRCLDFLTSNQGVVSIFFNTPENYAFTSGSLLNTYICFRSSSDFVTYNTKLTFHLYSIFHRLSLASENFRKDFMDHQTFDLALRKAFFETRAYSAAEPFLRQFFAWVVQSPELRRKWIGQFLDWGCKLFSTMFKRILEEGFLPLLRERSECVYMSETDGLSTLIVDGLNSKQALNGEEWKLLYEVIGRATEYWQEMTEEETARLNLQSLTTVARYITQLLSFLLQKCPEAVHHGIHCFMNVLRLPLEDHLLLEMVKSLEEASKKDADENIKLEIFSACTAFIARIPENLYPNAANLALISAFTAGSKSLLPQLSIHLSVLNKVLESEPSHDLFHVSQLVSWAASEGWFLPGPGRDTITAFLKRVLPLVPTPENVGGVMNQHLASFLASGVHDQEQFPSYLSLIEELFDLYQTSISEENQHTISKLSTPK